jgi:hypothetical protein
VIRTEFEGDVANFMSLVGGFVRLFQLSCCRPLHCTGAGRYEGSLASARHAEDRGSQFSSSSVQCCVPARPLPEGLCRASRFRSRACPSPQPRSKFFSMVKCGNLALLVARSVQGERRALVAHKEVHVNCALRASVVGRVMARRRLGCLRKNTADHAGRTTFSRPTKIE